MNTTMRHDAEAQAWATVTTALQEAARFTFEGRREQAKQCVEIASAAEHVAYRLGLTVGDPR